MNCTNFFGIFIVLLTAQFYKNNCCLGQEPGEPKLTCHGALGVWAHKMMGEIMKCNAEYNNDEPNRMRMPTKPWKYPPMDCMFKCAGIKIGLLGEDGSLSEKKAFEFVDENVYEEYRELALDILGTCFVEHGSAVDPKQADCSSYSGMFSCITKAAPRIRKACYGF